VVAAAMIARSSSRENSFMVSWMFWMLDIAW
jgi:hypothetical protein